MITTWKRKIKTLDLSKKMENKLRYVIRWSPYHAHFYEQMSSIFNYFLWNFFLPLLPNKILSWKYSQSKKISLHTCQLIFQIFTKNNYFYFLFTYCYQTDPKNNIYYRTPSLTKIFYKKYKNLMIKNTYVMLCIRFT